MPMSRIGPLALSVALPVLLATALASPALSQPSATASVRCDVRSVERKLGPTYVTSLTADGVSCRAAKSFVKAFHACRRAQGGVKGRCTKRVRGFRCAEKRSSIPTQFSSKVTCTKTGSRVVHTYTQFT